MTKPKIALVAGILIAAVSVTLKVKAKQPDAPVAGAPPVGLRCLVMLDPSSDRAPVHGTEAMRKTGYTPEGTVEGVLVSMEGDWVILKDGTYENWIPRDKVLFLRASR